MGAGARHGRHGVRVVDLRGVKVTNVTALSDKQARDNKLLAARCAKLERDKDRACKDRTPSPPGDKGHKVADLEREVEALVARAELAERALAESRLDRNEAEMRLAAAAAEAEARALKEASTDRETLRMNVAEWEAVVKRCRDKIGTARIALSRVQTDIARGAPSCASRWTSSAAATPSRTTSCTRRSSTLMTSAAWSTSTKPCAPRCIGSSPG